MPPLVVLRLRYGSIIRFAFGNHLPYHLAFTERTKPTGPHHRHPAAGSTSGEGRGGFLCASGSHWKDVSCSQRTAPRQAGFQQQALHIRSGT